MNKLLTTTAICFIGFQSYAACNSQPTAGDDKLETGFDNITCNTGDTHQSFDLLGGRDKITIGGTSQVTGSIKGDVYNNVDNVLDNTGVSVDDTIIVTDSAHVNIIYGEFIEGGKNLFGQKDKIIIESQQDNEADYSTRYIFGDYFYNSEDVNGGVDEIEILNGAHVEDVEGERLDRTLNATAGGDVIKVTSMNSPSRFSKVDKLYGEFITDSENATAGGDTIIVEYNAEADTIYGDYFLNTKGSSTETGEKSIYY